MTLNTPTILPAHSTATEKQLADVAWRLDSPPDISVVIDPKSISADLLPWLAWAQSVDVWDSDDTLAIKRALVATSAELHRLKGTLEGFRRICSIFGATLASVQRPPSRMFASRGYTEAERDALLARLPQLRVKARADRGAAVKNGAYCGHCCLGHTFLVPTDAASKTLPEVAYVDGDSQQMLPVELLKTDDGQSYIRTSLGATRKYSTYCGHFLRYLAPDDSAERVYSFYTTYDQSTGVRRKTLLPGLSPAAVYTDTNADAATHPRSFFVGSHRGGCYLRGYLAPSDAETHVYKRIYLFDRARTLEAHGGSTYLGHTSLGMHPYTAMLRVVWPGRRNPLCFGRYCRGFLHPPDMSRYNRFLAALAWGKSARDKVLLDTYSYRPLTASTTRTCSTALHCGQLIKRF